MFRFLFRAACAGVFLGGWGLAALSLHVVRTPDKIGLLPKDRLGVFDTYVDARTWTLADLPAHAPLVKRMLQADKADWFSYMAQPSGGDVAKQLQSAIDGASSSPDDSLLGSFKTFFSQNQRTAPSKASFDVPAIPVDF